MQYCTMRDAEMSLCRLSVRAAVYQSTKTLIKMYAAKMLARLPSAGLQTVFPVCLPPNNSLFL